MRGLGIVLSKELDAQFRGMSFWIAAAFLITLEGFLFVLNLAVFARQGMVFGGTMGPDFNDQVLAPMVSESGFLLMLVLPLFTAVLFAQEKREGTLEFLVSQPISGAAIVLGKFLSATLTLFVVVALPKLGILWIARGGGVDMGQFAAGMAGLFLLAAAMAALGLFVSSLTDHVVFAFAFTLLLGIALWVVGFFDQTSFDPRAGLLAQISLPDRLEGFSMGLVRLEDVVFFVSFTWFWLFATRRGLEAQGWT